ncbi:GNAT family N-acetyltransferase [Microcella daejeonensis]|uniref:GNAT family N-acetyltransferase n=1 Tax=Microcella daejeonensis TaxID=2994971 RepID=A0A9E8S8G0_9MICO|nr:GNAT family N-acetyltransferase [Microcella daejeonensis]WAB80406.1 GNAT family N-acetyltransferase [Microcella daejeonensis]
MSQDRAPMTEARVRRCTPDDAAALAAHVPGARHYAAGAFDRQRRGEVDFLVAFHAGLAAGSAELTFDDPPELKNLSVAPASRGQGLGSALIRYAEGLVENRDPEARPGQRSLTLGVGLENPGAARLYERIGYVRTGHVATTTYTYIDDDGVEHTVTEQDEDLIKRW